MPTTPRSDPAGEALRPVSAAELLDPVAYPHPVARARIVETNTSLVVLTGDYAYKIKKPVRLEFLDASTLARRRLLCEEELRLNTRLAPELYLEVVPIVRAAAGIRVGAAGEAVEYAVRMRQFDGSQELSALLERGAVDASEIADLARRVARFHAAAPRDAGREGANTARMRAAVLGNLATLLAHVGGELGAPGLGKLIDWTHDVLQRAAARFRAREAAGFVRECHGDLHSRNIVRWRGRLLPFDCLEFDPALRWIDVMSDVAFLFMDLSGRARADLAAQFLDAYLDESGDYRGVALLPFYAVYRALVRAMVDALAAEKTAADERTRWVFSDRARARIHTAAGFAKPRPPPLIAMHGPSGAGKSWLSERLVPRIGAVRVRSDVERRRLAGDAPPGHDSRWDALTYARLIDCAAGCLAGGVPTIVDATFGRRADRNRLRALAAAARVPLIFLSCTADRAQLAANIAARRRRGDDPSDADLAVLDVQLAAMEPFGDDERAQVVEIASGGPDAVDRAGAAIGALPR
ncbi:MAG TPA: AAA family ATPase [Steroidobacteraceae bacterium]|nr:AAA family ATPase [Steroidobacteraceae bacterium]